MVEKITERMTALWVSIRLSYRLFLDQRVPLWTKIIPVLTIVYLLSPLDLIPDFLLVIGQLDDLFVLSSGLRLFEQLAPPHVVAEHREALEAQMDTPHVERY